MVRFGDLLESLDPVWIEHGNRVGCLARLVAAELGWSDERLDRLEEAGSLHDVGKSKIDAAILTKPESLTPGEWDVVRQHPRLGYELVKGLVHPETSLAVLSHHEWFDGTGYPHGLSADRIPIAARVLSVADAFDAMVSDRPYQKRLPVEFALHELHRFAGSQFDPDLVEILAVILEQQLELGDTSIPITIDFSAA